MPRGRFTEKFNYVFGNAFENGIAMWILVAHGSNAMLRRDSSTHNVIRMRVCLQNVDRGLLSINLAADSSASSPLVNTRLPFPAISVECLPNEEDQSDDCDGDILPTRNLRLECVNGLPIDNTSQTTTCDECHLGPLEFAVLSFEVLCPLDVRTETDFIASIKQIRVDAAECTPCVPHTPRRHLSVASTLIDEDKIWDYYVEIPGGVILLRDRALNSTI
eukprot:CAMPEP_0174984402 /NCGR_PEP_ID=MMETSP0004_2-20121128/17702_1 /TAXON_ID=420556 /ORGANISM="Ochromonas sp., Strain CCMP1393" /LENGTH=218 /DNA_ID=CAMNT_0016236807 /DNA_START=653 /DNA_END=1309 /DNA_ORIENTATION=-